MQTQNFSRSFYRDSSLLPQRVVFENGLESRVAATQTEVKEINTALRFEGTNVPSNYQKCEHIKRGFYLSVSKWENMKNDPRAQADLVRLQNRFEKCTQTYAELAQALQNPSHPFWQALRKANRCSVPWLSQLDPNGAEVTNWKNNLEQQKNAGGAEADEAVLLAGMARDEGGYGRLNALASAFRQFELGIKIDGAWGEDSEKADNDKVCSEEIKKTLVKAATKDTKALAKECEQTERSVYAITFETQTFTRDTGKTLEGTLDTAKEIITDPFGPYYRHEFHGKIDTAPGDLFEATKEGPILRDLAELLEVDPNLEGEERQTATIKSLDKSYLNSKHAQGDINYIKPLVIKERELVSHITDLSVHLQDAQAREDRITALRAELAEAQADAETTTKAAEIQAILDAELAKPSAAELNGKLDTLNVEHKNVVADLEKVDSKSRRLAEILVDNNVDDLKSLEARFSNENKGAAVRDAFRAEKEDFWNINDLQKPFAEEREDIFEDHPNFAKLYGEMMQDGRLSPEQINGKKLGEVMAIMAKKLGVAFFSEGFLTDNSMTLTGRVDAATQQINTLEPTKFPHGIGDIFRMLAWAGAGQAAEIGPILDLKGTVNYEELLHDEKIVEAIQFLLKKYGITAEHIPHLQQMLHMINTGGQVKIEGGDCAKPIILPSWIWRKNTILINLMLKFLLAGGTSDSGCIGGCGPNASGNQSVFAPTDLG